MSKAAIHKRDAAHVWLRTSTVGVDGETTVSFAIPVAHSNVRFAELVETQRQAGILSVHQHLEVPSGDAFVLDTIGLRVDRPSLLSSLDNAHGMVTVKITDVTHGRKRIKSVRQHYSLRARSGLQAHGYTTATFVPAAIYARLRERAREPQRGHSERQDQSGTWRVTLSIDRTDPILADHDTDHVSAMAVVCAIEESMTKSQDHSVLASSDLRFTSYIELDPVPVLMFKSAASGDFSGLLEQGGIVRARFEGGMSKMEGENE